MIHFALHMNFLICPYTIYCLGVNEQKKVIICLDVKWFCNSDYYTWCIIMFRLPLGSGTGAVWWCVELRPSGFPAGGEWSEPRRVPAERGQPASRRERCHHSGLHLRAGHASWWRPALLSARCAQPPLHTPGWEPETWRLVVKRPVISLLTTHYLCIEELRVLSYRAHPALKTMLTVS